MKNGIHNNTILINITLLICLYLIFTAGNCQGVIDTLEDDSDHCEVDINGPESTVYTENDEITFSAHLEKWEYLDETSGQYPDGKKPELYGVQWESDIDGIIYKQEYNVRHEADPLFFINTLTPGKHTIRCYALVGGFLAKSCYDEIYIEIDEVIEPENQIDYLDFSFELDEAETKTAFSTGAVSYSTRISHDLSSKCGESTFSDNIYTTIFDGRCNSITGYMTVTFLDNPSRVDVHAEWSRPSSDCISNYIVDYEGIPYNGTNGTASDLYYESGSAVSRINISQYGVICTTFTKELLNTNCGDEAEIGVWIFYVR